MSQTQRRLLQAIGVLVVLLIWEGVGRIMGEALFAPVSVVVREYLAHVVGGIVTSLHDTGEIETL
jgi:hypothetical protein